MSVLLKSALEEAVEMLPSKLRPEGVLPAIKKAGVKDEELRLSGVLSELPNALKGLPTDEKGRIETGVLKGGYVNAIRTDKFDINEKGFEEGMGNPGYANIVPATVNVAEKNYRERVYRFSAANPVKNASGHFPESDYLMHTRVWDDLIGDADTRVIGEIQSDLHQKDKSLPTRKLDDSTLRAITTFLTLAGPRVDEQTAFILKNAFTGVETGLTEEQQAEGVAKLMELTKNGASSDEIDKVVKQLYLPAKKDAAWETSWARKGLENEILQAIKDGKQQIAIAIKNSKLAPDGKDAVKAALDLALARIPSIANTSNIDELIDVSTAITSALPARFTRPGSVSRRALKLVNDLVNNKRDETAIKSAFDELAVLHTVPSSVMPALDVAVERIAALTDDSLNYEFDEALAAIKNELPPELNHHDADDVREAISDMVYSRSTPIAIAETFASIANGTPQLTSKPLDTMYRSGGVQKWYETYVDPLSEKLAKQMGVESRVVSKGGVDYRVIDFNSKPNTPEFKKWFGASKVVTKDNKPLVLYHGTQSAAFKDFKPSGEANMFGKNEQYYFTDSFDEAKGYATGNADTAAKGRSGTGHVVNAYLKMEKPAILTADEFNVTDVPVQEYLENLDMDGLYDAIRKAGYDGIVYDGEFALAPVVGKHYVVFSPAQIQRAGPKEAAENAFKLYSAGGGLAMYLAYKQGYSEDEVTQYMLEQGFGADEIEKAKADQADIAAKVQAAEAEGYSEDEIVQFMKDGGMPESPASVVDKQADKVDLAKLPPSNDANDTAIAAVANATEDMTADELVSHLQVIAPNMSSVT
ncbi:MAG: hypothetical protein ACRCSS_04910, partial [Shewanella sp.]